jgi:ketosteroid isomerase-like protein
MNPLLSKSRQNNYSSKNDFMTTQEIAEKLTAYCREGKFEQTQKELFADDAVSIEPVASEMFEKETKGLQAIIEKGEKFESMVEAYHKLEVSEPIVASQSFAVVMRMDITMKGKGRMDMKELCLYKVKDGKIISEEFFM